MEYFINYRPLMGVDISQHRAPIGYHNDDIIGLIEDAINGHPGSCPLEGAQEAINDGSLWSDRGALEMIAEAIREHLK